MRLFHQSCALHIAFSKLFLHRWRCGCKIFLYYISNSKRTFCIGIKVHALRITIKLGFWETLGVFGRSRVKSGFFACCVIKRVADRALRRHL